MVAEDALHMLGDNGVESAIIVTAPDKTDLRARLGDGPVGGVGLTWLERTNSPSVPHTLQSARADVGSADVLLWFPDILVKPRNIVRALIAGHAQSGADVTLALVPSDRGDKVDIVSVDAANRILQISPKPGAGISGWTWVSAIWTAEFFAFLDEFVDARGEDDGAEIHVGDVINAGLDSNFIVRSVNFTDGSALDIGTPDDLARLWGGT